MGPSASFSLLELLKSYRFVIPGDEISESYPIPSPIFYYFELIREVLANTGYVSEEISLMRVVPS